MALQLLDLDWLFSSSASPAAHFAGELLAYSSDDKTAIPSRSYVPRADVSTCAGSSYLTGSTAGSAVTIYSLDRLHLTLESNQLPTVVDPFGTDRIPSCLSTCNPVRFQLTVRTMACEGEGSCLAAGRHRKRADHSPPEVSWKGDDLPEDETVVVTADSTPFVPPAAVPSRDRPSLLVAFPLLQVLLEELGASPAALNQLSWEALSSIQRWEDLPALIPELSSSTWKRCRLLTGNLDYRRLVKHCQNGLLRDLIDFALDSLFPPAARPDFSCWDEGKWWSILHRHGVRNLREFRRSMEQIYAALHPDCPSNCQHHSSESRAAFDCGIWRRRLDESASWQYLWRSIEHWSAGWQHHSRTDSHLRKPVDTLVTYTVQGKWVQGGSQHQIHLDSASLRNSLGDACHQVVSGHSYSLDLVESLLLSRK